jgi:hypothetical protein
MKWTTGIVVSLVAILIGAVVRAYVIARLWSWFVAPTFHLPEISLSTAFGLSLFASVFLPRPQTPDTKGMDTAEKVGVVAGEFLGQVLGYGLVLVMGALVHGAASGG